ncbi:hypothetical protein NHX12_022054 [Muraenolepis orangiensis]|uniref:ZBR-type domain-containing protein n=1 Tax=Muraenolepis orangiensis TaxID=630683 RepID=A0A9Q0EMH5_9TELE|nr:hypothetical protein NHX12_022054 [Muraenolepis orangiensis]
MRFFLQVFMVSLAQSNEAAMKSPSGCKTLRNSRRIKELLMAKAISSPAEVESVPVGVHNKENRDAARHHSPQDTFPGNGLDDSGYLSLQNSQVSDHNDEADRMREPALDIPSPRATTCKSSPSSAECHPSLRSSTPGVLLRSSTPGMLLRSSTPRVSLRSSTPRVSPRSSTPRALQRASTPRVLLGSSTPSLPIVRFQQLVCAELALSFQKNQRYDWSIVSLLAEKHLLDRVIGGQMGVAHVDVFSGLLTRNLGRILGCVLALLGDLDLISCRMVSRTWHKMILEDSAATRRIQRARQHMASHPPMSRVVTGSGLTRDSGHPRVVLSSMQTLASTFSPAATSGIPPREQTPSSSQKRFNTFLQAASGLKSHEGLRCCRRCHSPARHNSETQRATCTRPSCEFDFCTLCQEAFHGARPCRTLKPHRTSVPGGKHNKHSLRRL